MLLLILPQLFLDSSPKDDFFYHLLTLKLFQTCMSFFCWAIVWKNTVEVSWDQKRFVTNIIQMMTKFSFLGELSF